MGSRITRPDSPELDGDDSLPPWLEASIKSAYAEGAKIGHRASREHGVKKAGVDAWDAGKFVVGLIITLLAAWWGLSEMLHSKPSRDEVHEQMVDASHDVEANTQAIGAIDKKLDRVEIRQETMVETLREIKGDVKNLNGRRRR